jgi:DNA-binding FrmR family transcriptional regulator
VSRDARPGAVLEHQLRDVVATLVDGHLRHCVLDAIEQGQRPVEVERLFAPIRDIILAPQR